MARDAAGNEHDARAAIGVGPLGEGDRRMEDMVNAVDNDRCLLPAEIENAFDPQQILAACAAQIRQPLRNRHPVERFVERDHEAGDPCIVAVMGVIVVLVRRLAGSCERLLVEPARNVDRFFLGIDQGGTE